MTIRDSILQIEQASRALLAACESLRKSLPHEASAGEAEQIIAFVADQYGYTFGAMQSRSRNAHIVKARHVGIYLARELCEISTATLGQILQRDHGSMIHATAAVKDRIEIDPQFANKVDRIRELLTQRRMAA